MSEAHAKWGKPNWGKPSGDEPNRDHPYSDEPYGGEPSSGGRSLDELDWYGPHWKSRWDKPVKHFEDPGTGFSGWRARIGQDRGVPTPAIAGDTLIVGGGFGSHEVFGFDRTTGKLNWHRRTRDDGPTAISVLGRYAAFNTESCTVEIVDVEDGRTLWAHWLGDPLLGQPAIGLEKVFMAFPGQGTHWLAAFRLTDGARLWTEPLEHDVITAPVVAEGRLYLSTFDGSVHCFDPETGYREWRRPMNATSAPWIADGDVYVAHRGEDTHGAGGASAGAAGSEQSSAGSGGSSQAGGHTPGPRGSAHPARSPAERVPTERTSRIHGKRPELSRPYARKLAHYLEQNWGAAQKDQYRAWDQAVAFANAPASAKLDSTARLVGEETVSRAWRYQGSRPGVIEGVLFDTTGNRLEARDVSDDRLLWEWEHTGIEGERSLTPPAVANGRVWVGTWSGSVVSLDAKTGAERWSVPVGAPVHWQPVVDRGRVYAGLQNGELVCFATGDAQDDGWGMWGGGPGHNGRGDRDC